MKKSILAIAVIASVGMACFSSCSEAEEATTEQTAEEVYYCPMKCEGEKMYADADTKCPVCKMDLVKD
ncbi:MAG: heavy metal-binding domain-containing protein [Crocinitomicaceae bacterium]|nr:heavy metal-binding domain-containing protein [Crocinitomicaceae bacterium]